MNPPTALEPSLLRELRAAITRWRFYVGEKYLGGFSAEPNETAEQARQRFLKICRVHEGKEISVRGGR